MSKNLAKVQDMLDGNYKSKIQVGYSKTEETRQVGDKWTDSDGVEWEQKEGYIYKVPTLPNVGMFSKQCKNCKKNCSPKTAKPWDRDTYKADGRCYHCQINYEIDLKADKWIRWFAYRRLKDLRNMTALEKDMEQWIVELEKQKNEKVFDKKVANALANGEVEMSIKKNTQ
tara:strand:+ start:50 stop:562 length:513 start_codon:yes stop_codon:yes gene_type:complete